MPAAVSIHSVTSLLEEWFARTGRDYPWRRTHDPYAILVSEVMLQQTQIATVLSRGYFENWMARFPDFSTLAAAHENDVLKAWEGLGYYRRARNLQKLARVLTAEHAGLMPRDYQSILSLPGIGPYTAGAISSFAFDEARPVVDGNVARVLSRLYDDDTPVDSKHGQSRLWERATDLVHAATSPRIFNSALMELGQTLCRTGAPDCLLCPLKRECRTTRAAQLPVKSRRTPLTDVQEHVFLLIKEGRILLEQETGSRRTGMWKLPTLPEEHQSLPILYQTRYGITRYRVHLFIHRAPPQIAPIQHQSFFPPSDLPTLVMPSPYRRALESVLSLIEPKDF